MSRSAQIRVLIADDHPLVRLGLETMLRSAPDMEVVAIAADGDEAVRQALRTRPDVILLDVRMPVKDGLTALVEIKQALPAARCLMLTGSNDSQPMLQAMQLGAAGHLVKDGGMDAVLRAIRAVYHGDGALDPATTQQLITAYRARQTAARPDDDLTVAELRVLKLLTRGLSNRQIAAELGVSVRTVTSHIGHILAKLGVQNRVQAALYARERGLTA